ncbi:MFS transporter [Streptomyces sp. NPDC048717]|uniref:MFS transporter n=1 Tax=Streptomyces sp. NPDC048717 TaxID=3154928 RepID=UPI003445E14F
MTLAARVPALLREREFRRYWTGQTVSLAGDQVALMALPLAAVLVLGADAAEMGWLKTAELLPALLFNLPFGAWADRRARRRHVMIAADVVRAALVLSLPVAYFLDVLTLGQLYAVAFTVGVSGVLFDVCNATLFVALVPVERYVQANSLVNGSRSMAWLAGPGAAGVLVQILTAPFALVANAFTYLVSAACLARIAPAEPAPAPVEKGHFTEGMRWLVGNRLMRALFAAAGTVQFFNFMFSTLFVLYVTTTLGLSAGVLGAVLSTGAIGGLIGASVASRVVRRIGVGRSTVFGFLGFGLPLLLIPLAAGPKPLVVGLLIVAEFLSCVGVMLLDIAIGSLQMALVPDAIRGRVMGAYRTLNHGFRPLGALAGGLLGSAIGLRPTLWIATAGTVLAVLWVLPSPLARMRELPEPPMDPRPGPLPGPRSGAGPEPVAVKGADGAEG